MLRKLTPAPQVTRYHFQGEILAHRHGVHVHQAAGAVLGIGQHRIQALPVLLVHGGQDFGDHFIRQILDQVGDIVDVHGARGRHQLGAVHFIDEIVSHPFRDLQHYFAGDVGTDQGPQGITLGRRHAFQEFTDIRWMQFGQHGARGLGMILVEGG